MHGEKSVRHGVGSESDRVFFTKRGFCGEQAAEKPVLRGVPGRFSGISPNLWTQDGAVFDKACVGAGSFPESLT